MGENAFELQTSDRPQNAIDTYQESTQRYTSGGATAVYHSHRRNADLDLKIVHIVEAMVRQPLSWDRRRLFSHPGFCHAATEGDMDVRTGAGDDSDRLVGGMLGSRRWALGKRTRLAVDAYSGKRASAQNSSPFSVHITAATVELHATTKETVAELVRRVTQEGCCILTGPLPHHQHEHRSAPACSGRSQPQSCTSLPRDPGAATHRRRQQTSQPPWPYRPQQS